MCPVQQREGVVGTTSAAPPAPPAPVMLPYHGGGMRGAKTPIQIGLTSKGELIWIFPTKIEKENKA